MFTRELNTAEALRLAKWSFTTRRVRRTDVVRGLADVESATAGDLILAEVAEIGQHKKLQISTGRYSDLYVGDRVVVACGARYAPDQFEAEAAIAGAGADLVAAGGLAGRVVCTHAKMAPPTRLAPLARLADREGRPLGLAAYALARLVPVAPRPSVIAVLGSSMNSGKTTTAVSLARGLRLAGLQVGGAKATGTGAFADVNAFYDAGIWDVLDFTDVGLASTFQVPLDRLETVATSLVAHLQAAGCQAVVMEIADGVLQTETAALMRSPKFHALVDGVVFAAADALGAVTGVRAVAEAGLHLVGLSGVLSMSPLACREATRALDSRCYTRQELFDPAIATSILCAAIAGLDAPRRVAVAA